jgi:hypothetical protein
MRRGQITVALVVVGMLSTLVCTRTLGAQILDCRKDPCKVEDIVKGLQSVFRGPPSIVGMPAVAMPMPVAPKVYFATNSDRISPEYYPELNKFGEALTRLQSPVEISGHTDSIGSDKLNQILSERRAVSVKRYLEQHFSLPAERLVAKGYGKTRPITTNDTESGRKQNRRIEVVLKP